MSFKSHSKLNIPNGIVVAYLPKSIDIKINTKCNPLNVFTNSKDGRCYELKTSKENAFEGQILRSWKEEKFWNIVIMFAPHQKF